MPVVERLQAALLGIMQDADALGYQGRYQQIAPVIAATHDLNEIARIAVGRYWGQLDEQQKAVLVETFAAFIIANYAFRFDGFSGQSFVVRSADTRDGDRAVVHTELVKPNGEVRRFDYYLRRTQGTWRIVNIVVDGVSDLSIKRTEFASILRKESFAALIAKMQRKIDKLSDSEISVPDAR